MDWMRDWVQAVRECEGGALGTVLCLALLFIWYCYRVGCENASYTPESRSSPPELSSTKLRPTLGGVRTRGGTNEEELNGFAYCQSPECFRCSRPGDGFNQRLYHNLQDYAKRYTWA
ncbi:aspartate beta-hydroxylase domain-containing protein 2, partial [Tachysurus ichikawai]